MHPQALANILKRKAAVLEALERPKPSRQHSDLPTFMASLWPQVLPMMPRHS